MSAFWRVLLYASLATCFPPSWALNAQTQTHPEATPAASAVSLSETEIYKAPESSQELVLQEMAGRAAVIFTGTVTQVKKVGEADPGSSTSASVVEVDFAVDTGIRGSSSGSVFTMREWSGMWRDNPRFAVGQRLLMLLHAAGPSGLSSPIDGLDGAIPIKASNSFPSFLSAFTTSMADTLPQEDAVDMRWLQAKTLKAPVIEDAPTASPGESFAGLATTSALSASTASSPTPVAKLSTTLTLSRVLSLLMSVQGTGNASH